MNRVALYCRLSEEDRCKASSAEDSNSIKNQKALLLQYAAKNHWDVYDIYSDDDYGGADRTRPAFNRMIADAQAHKFDIILCKSQSRFSREVEVIEKYLHRLFPLWGIRFLSLIDHSDSMNEENHILRQMNSIMDEKYLSDLSKNIRTVLTCRRKAGFHIGSFAPYGYQKDPDQKGHLLIDAEAAAIVQEIFTLFAQGCGKTAIARLLNDNGIPNPTEYKRLQGLHYQQPKQKNSTLWSYSAIAGILKNECYIGNMVQGKYGSVSYKTKQNKPRPKEDWYRVEGTHQAIIEKGLWEQVQKMLVEKAKPFSCGTLGLFARKARCAACGYTLRSTKSHGRYYLQCPNRHISKNACVGAFLSVKRLEQLVLAEWNTLSALYLNTEELEKKLDVCSNLEQQKNNLQKTLLAYRKKTETIQKAIRSLYLDKIQGILSDETYLDFFQQFSAEKQQLETQIQATEQKIQALEEHLSHGDNRRAILEKYLPLSHLTREMVEILVDYVVVGKRIPGTRDVPIEIHWNF